MGASSARGGTVTLTTTLGVLDPLGDGTAAQKLELPTPADGAVTATLRAGTFSGVTRVRASIGGVSVEKELTLAPALPTVIEVIAGTYALAAGSATSELTLYLPRDEAGSAVSAGVTWCIGSLKGYFCKQCHHTGPRTVREDPGLSYSNAVSRTVVYPSTTHPTAAARPRATGRSSRCTSACSGRWLKMSYGTGSISRLQPVSKTVTRIGVGWGLMGRRNRSKPLFGSAQPNCRSWDGVLRRCPGLEDQNQGDAGEDLVEVRASRRRCQPVAKTAA